jgi:hypothetical protein
MSWKRGEKPTDYELARLQDWTERADIELHGPEGDTGIVAEWRDFKAYMKAGIVIGGALLAIPAILVSMSALGWIHLH